MVTETRRKATGGKRGNNEGSIKHRADGRYEARVSLPNGGRKSVYGKTRREVQEKMTMLHRDVQQGLPIPVGRQTLGQYLDEWLESSAKPTIAPATYVSYRQLLATHITPRIGRTPLATLAPSHVQRLQQEMLAAGLSPRTVQYARAVLRRALGQAMKWGLIARNPVPLVDAPRSVQHDARFLTMAEARQLTQSLAGDHLEPLILLILTTGLRRGEALSLRWQDADLDRATLRVEGQYQRWDGVWQWRPLKTAASRRALELPPFLLAALRSHRTRQLEERLAAGVEWQDMGLIFPSATGAPQDGSSLSHQFAKRVKRAGLEPIPLHGLRRSAATFLLAQGLTLGQVQKVLGHAQIALTANLYAHTSPEIASQAAAAMQGLFGTG